MMKTLIFKGPVFTASGYGVHSRQLLKAVLSCGLYDVYVHPIPWGNTPIIYEENEFYNLVREFAEKPRPKMFDVSLQVSIPNEFSKLAKINVGFTAGIETTAVSPDWIAKCNEEIDLLFVPSEHAKQSFLLPAFKLQDGQELKLNKVPIISPEGFNDTFYNNESVKNNCFNFSTKKNVLFVGLGIGELDKIGEERKNASLLIKWFCEEFKDNKEVGLILKTGIVNNCLIDFETAKKKIELIKVSTGCGQYPTIHLVHGRLTDEQMAKLYKHDSVKAFVTLTHGECWGLPILEAAACETPIVATDWSGHLDFLVKGGVKFFEPVDCEIKQIPDSAEWKGVIEKFSGWAYPKEESAKFAMRKALFENNFLNNKEKFLCKHVHQNYTEEKINIKFVKKFVEEVKKVEMYNPKTREGVVQSMKNLLMNDRCKKLLYTMPMSAGDVYLSTAIIRELKKKFPNHNIYFATQQKYMSILKDNPDVYGVIPYQQWMMDISICEDIFDEVYTPNLAIQMNFSNWVHRGKGRHILKEMAVNCNVELNIDSDYFIKLEKPDYELPEFFILFDPGSGNGQWEARNYSYWKDVLVNLKREIGADFFILQNGLGNEKYFEECVDFRGKAKTVNELAYVISKAKLVLGIDSLPMHLAAGLGINSVSIFGSSYAKSTGPYPLKKKNKTINLTLETLDRFTCDRACYKHTCEVNRDNPCINNIDARKICVVAATNIKDFNCNEGVFERFKEYVPKISGYTHTLNAESQRYPFIESIKSLLGFCDEVIVVDGKSTDDTVKMIENLKDDRIKIIENSWDWDNPGEDGAQKAFARAMCSGDFLFQIDVDEVVHEEDYDKIKQLCRKFPNDVDLIHLPVVELWGSENNVRTDRHSWKWRLSRNDFMITHGIHKNARIEKDGKIFAKKGMSDGCEYVDLMNHEFIPHKGFYTQDLENLRQRKPEEYGKKMNKIFKELPSIYHYSWVDIPRKIKNFKTSWNKLWSNLYGEENLTDRFPSIKNENDIENINKETERLLKQGGEHNKSITFKLEKTNPKVMKNWLKEINK